MVSRKAKHDGHARTRSRLQPPPFSFDLPDDVKVKPALHSQPGLVELSFWKLDDTKLFTLVMDEKGLASFFAALCELGVKPSRELADAFVPLRAKEGDFNPLIAQIREHLPPACAELAVDIVEGRFQIAAHRPPSTETLRQYLHIGHFIDKRRDEGVAEGKARGEAAQKFRVSKRTVRRAYDYCRGKWVRGKVV
jgi:hypothetical protein